MCAHLHSTYPSRIAREIAPETFRTIRISASLVLHLPNLTIPELSVDDKAQDFVNHEGIAPLTGEQRRQFHDAVKVLRIRPLSLESTTQSDGLQKAFHRRNGVGNVCKALEQWPKLYALGKEE